jgi:RNA polymerase sigma-70 factor (ECF subfamily)
MKLEAKDLGPIADPLPYLYRMANNLMLDRYRSATRRERREQDWAEGAGGVMADPSEDVAIDERLILNQRLEEARAVLRSLGPRVEMVFRRFRIEGVGQRAIAEELGVSLTTVEKDLQKAYRAMIALKQKLETE